MKDKEKGLAKEEILWFIQMINYKENKRLGNSMADMSYMEGINLKSKLRKLL